MTTGYANISICRTVDSWDIYFESTDPAAVAIVGAKAGHFGDKCKIFVYEVSEDVEYATKISFPDGAFRKEGYEADIFRIRVINYLCSMDWKPFQAFSSSPSCKELHFRRESE